MPSQEEEEEEEDLWFHHSKMSWHYRMYPSSNLLIRQRQQQQESESVMPPILSNFLATIGRGPVGGSRSNKSPNNNDSNNKDGDHQQDSSQASNQTVSIISNIMEIDNPTHSTLSMGQHQRYLKLAKQATTHNNNDYSSWRPNYHQKQEILALQALVEAEQQHYRQAVQAFWEDGKSRVWTGFTTSAKDVASVFVNYAAFPEAIQQRWLEEFKGRSYGPCCQIISMEHATGAMSGAATSSSSRTTKSSPTNRKMWYVDGVKSQTLTQDSTANPTTADDDDDDDHVQPPSLPPVGSQVPLPPSSSFSNNNNKKKDGDRGIVFLHHDDAALALAKGHKASMVATMEALETILEDPQPPQPQWMLPVHFRDGIAILDLPVPGPFSSPRACLTKGLQQAMVQQPWPAAVHDNNTNTTTSSPKEQREKPPFRYVLWTLPQVASLSGITQQPQPTTTTTTAKGSTKAKQLRMVVRVPNHNLQMRAHIEYFPERSQERIAAQERSLWILDHFLNFQRAVLGRIDPVSCRVLKWEETSLAHALAVSCMREGNNDMAWSSPLSKFTKHHNQQQQQHQPGSSQNNDPLDRWHALVHFLHAIPTIGRQQGNFLLCLPGRDSNSNKFMPRSVSVHPLLVPSAAAGAASAGTSSARSAIIHVEAELTRAGEVPLGITGVHRSMCDWEWKHDERIPFTFPVHHSKTNKPLTK